MFRGHSVGVEGDWASGEAEAAAPTHREIDRQLRRLARHRSGLDAEEARWLRCAEDQNSWRVLGYVHALEYLEEVFGYAPRTAQEKLRVARELGAMPALEAELESGSMQYSTVRALTRVATPETEASWIEKVQGCNLRQVEQMLSGHKKGDKPTDARDPTLVEHDVTWKLDAATSALLRETRRQLENELGHPVDDAIFIDMLCRRAIESVASADACDGAKRVSGPRTMIHMTTCRVCKSAVQHGAGVPVPVSREQLERAECDAIIVDDEHGKRATATIPPSMRRHVLARDEYRCRFPGCRSTRNLDAHHVKHRSDCGDHSSGNLATLCSGHHKLHHDGVITVNGDADEHLVFTRNGVVIRNEDERGLNGDGASSGAKPERNSASAGVTQPRSSARAGASRYRQVERDTLAKSALQLAGYRSSTATLAVERALAHVPAEASLEVLVKTALRHCSD